MRSKAPDFPIAPVLEALGAEDVPRIRGTGHAKMLCPFHPDTRPSASVSQYGFTCYSCGVTGDAISLLREQEGLDYQGSIRRAKEIAGDVGRQVQRPAAAGGWGSGSLLD